MRYVGCHKDYSLVDYIWCVKFRLCFIGWDSLYLTLLLSERRESLLILIHVFPHIYQVICLEREIERNMEVEPTARGCGDMILVFSGLICISHGGMELML